MLVNRRQVILRHQMHFSTTGDETSDVIFIQQRFEKWEHFRQLAASLQFVNKVMMQPILIILVKQYEIFTKSAPLRMVFKKALLSRPERARQQVTLSSSIHFLKNNIEEGNYPSCCTWGQFRQ